MRIKKIRRVVIGSDFLAVSLSDPWDCSNVLPKKSLDTQLFDFYLPWCCSRHLRKVTGMPVVTSYLSKTLRI